MPFNELLALLMLVSFFVLLMAGIPVALTLATAGLVFGYVGFGASLFNLLPNRLFGVVTNCVFTVVRARAWTSWLTAMSFIASVREPAFSISMTL